MAPRFGPSRGSGGARPAGRFRSGGFDGGLFRRRGWGGTRWTGVWPATYQGEYAQAYDPLTIVQRGNKFDVVRVGTEKPVASFNTLAEAQAYVARSMGLFGALGSLSGTVTNTVLIVGGIVAAGALYFVLKKK